MGGFSLESIRTESASADSDNDDDEKGFPAHDAAVQTRAMEGLRMKYWTQKWREKPLA